MVEGKVEDNTLLTELRVDVRYIKKAIEELTITLKEAAHKDDLKETEKRLVIVETKVSKLENFRYYILGAVTCVSALVTIIIEYLGHH